MKAIMLMFDTLNRRMLSPYGCDWVKTPNFQRLAARTATFDRSYIGSAPCMPARRELQTGRYNFLHRSWSPIEPYDDCMPEILKQAGIHSHLATDHYHYWQDGGATYHNRFNTYDFIRGQEGDAWHGDIASPPNVPEDCLRSRHINWVNRYHMQDECDQPQPKTFARGMDFIRVNAEEDNWFLQLETFDPHEPYFTKQNYKDLYPHDYDGPHFDWPRYERVTESPEMIEHCRLECAALHSMCDAYLGKVLDMMDELDLWKDTMLIVNTDHGFLLGEHDCWAKCWMPFYNEIAHTPLFIWDPRSKVQGERRQALVQTIDLPATILEFFGQELPPHMQGTPLKDTIADDTPVRESALFGIHGGHVNVTDGQYVYMRAWPGEENEPLFNYTLMPTHMNSIFSVEELQQATLAPPFSFTKQIPLLRTPADFWRTEYPYETMLFDVEADPQQKHPIDAPEIEARMIEHMVKLMKWNDAPAEQFERLGLTAPA